MHRRAVSALILASLLGWAADRACAREAVVSLAEAKLPDPGLSDAGRFGRFVDRSPRLRAQEPAPVSVSIEDLNRRQDPMTPRGAARAPSPYPIPAPEAPAAPAILAERVEPDPRPYQAGLAKMLAQHAGVALVLIGLTGPLRRRSPRRAQTV